MRPGRKTRGDERIGKKYIVPITYGYRTATLECTESAFGSTALSVLQREVMKIYVGVEMGSDGKSRTRWHGCVQWLLCYVLALASTAKI